MDIDTFDIICETVNNVFYEYYFVERILLKESNNEFNKFLYREKLCNDDEANTEHLVLNYSVFAKSIKNLVKHHHGDGSLDNIKLDKKLLYKRNNNKFINVKSSYLIFKKNKK